MYNTNLKNRRTASSAKKGSKAYFFLLRKGRWPGPLIAHEIVRTQGSDRSGSSCESCCSSLVPIATRRGLCIYIKSVQNSVRPGRHAVPLRILLMNLIALVVPIKFISHGKGNQPFPEPLQQGALSLTQQFLIFLEKMLIKRVLKTHFYKRRASPGPGNPEFES